jgi:hypothetical protein
MIRRDYILRMVEEFFEALRKIRALKKGERWEAASSALDAEFEKLVGAGPQAVARLSGVELLARLSEGEPTQVVRQKTLILTSLLGEAGDIATAGAQIAESREYYIKALDLLLDTLSREGVFEFPEFVPKVEALVSALADVPLPNATNAMLMQYYERTGCFDKAENALFAMLDSDPGNTAILDFGIMFYQRIRTSSDAALVSGNLPRAEVEAGLAELRQRKVSE